MGRRIKLIWYKKNWYHPNFLKRAAICAKKAKYTCRHCGKKRGEEYMAKTGRTDKVVIQAAHVNHDTWNGRAILIALCKQCHMRYDAPVHAIKTKRIHYRKIYTAMLNAGQLPIDWENAS